MEKQECQAYQSHGGEFKKQIIDTYNEVKPMPEIIGKSSSCPASFVKSVNEREHFNKINDLTPVQMELIQLRQEQEHLKKENRLLKQVFLIFAQK